LRTLEHKQDIIDEITEKINRGYTFEETFDYLFDTLPLYIPYNRIGIALLDEECKYIRAARARSDREIKLLSGYGLKLSSTSLERVVEAGEPRIINDLYHYFLSNPNSESTKMIIEEGMRSSITLPLTINSKCLGVMFFSSTKANAYGEEHIGLLKRIVNNMAISIEKSLLITNLVISTVGGFAKLVESRDPETGTHLERMSIYSKIIASELGTWEKYKDVIDNRFIENTYNYSILHDIGKVGIKDSILLKPGKLTKDEYETMKNHTIIGAEVFAGIQSKLGNYGPRLFQDAVDIILYHHEKYDGTGYPKGLRGEEIPLSARIVALADVFDALSSHRPYKKAFDIDTCYSIIMEGRGSHFDPDCVDAFVSLREEVEKVVHSLGIW